MKSDVLQKMFDNPPPTIGPPEAKDVPRMPTTRIPCSEEELQAHLEKYAKLMIEKGADDARIISARDVPQDPRVLLKCSSPKCPGYGISGSCPPHCTGNFQQAKEFLDAYNWAIIYRVDIPGEGRKYITGPESLDSLKTEEGRHRFGSFQRYCYHMGDAVESAAFYDGHYFAANCHFGPCLWSLCEGFDHCQEIKAKVCRFPTLARPSVEQTFCVDFIKLAAKQGWEHYMLGFCGYPQDYPEGYTSFQVGLILID
jgi:predicted metal-binding protein